jgi:hypothetical protein
MHVSSSSYDMHVSSSSYDRCECRRQRQPTARIILLI